MVCVNELTTVSTMQKVELKTTQKASGLYVQMCVDQVPMGMFVAGFKQDALAVIIISKGIPYIYSMVEDSSEFLDKDQTVDLFVDSMSRDLGPFVYYVGVIQVSWEKGRYVIRMSGMEVAAIYMYPDLQGPIVIDAPCHINPGEKHRYVADLSGDFLDAEVGLSVPGMQILSMQSISLIKVR